MFVGDRSFPLNRKEEKHQPTTTNMTVDSWIFALLKGMSWHCFRLSTYVEVVQLH